MDSLSKIIGMIDDNKLSQLGTLHSVDKVNTKITGSFILKSFIYAALQKIPLSLRSIENFTKNNKILSSELKANDQNKDIHYSSLSKRLKNININYFKDIYEDIVEKYHKDFPSKNSFHIFDSTIISISSLLMKNGLNCGGAEKDTHIKMSISLKNSIPSSVRFCTQASESSEDVALREAINTAKIQKEDILLFDRGIQKAETFEELTQEEKFFVSRIKVNRLHKILNHNTLHAHEDSDLTLFEDVQVHLFNQKNKEIKTPLRLIKAYKKDKEEIWFLTNIENVGAYEITLAYKRRWDIEVLFKFLKQHLQFKQFIHYDAQSMQVSLYCLLIAAILFTAYKNLNHLTGYKIAMLQFLHDLNKQIIKDIVLFCGGDPNLVDQKM